jgi:hypothetical protein
MKEGGGQFAAPDFRLYWDNACSVHHLTNERIEIANLLELCARQRVSNSPDNLLLQ